MSLEIDFGETLGEPRDAQNLWAEPIGGEMYESTKNIWPWTTSALDPNRKLVPSVYPERPLRRCPVANPSCLLLLKFVERCLDIPGFALAAWEVLRGQGIFITQDDEGNDIPRVFETEQELLQASDGIILAMQDDPDLQIDDRGFGSTTPS